MNRKYLVQAFAVLACLFMLSTSTAFSQDFCDNYFDRYRVCVEAREAGSNVDYDDCISYTNQTDCGNANCYWNTQGLPPPGVCIVDVCLADMDFSGRITGQDLGVFKKELARQDCEITPDVPAEAPVEKTGVFALCYDATGIERDCAGTGEDGEHRKGVGWPFPRFKDNGDNTATDTVTGLTWLRDANCMATNYPGIDNDVIAGDGAVTWQQALDFVGGINNETFSLCGAGKTDWRLPNIKELQSLIDFGQYDPALPFLFALWVANEQSSYYWSSTTLPSDTRNAWYVLMNYGYVGFVSKSYDSYVWPVRGGQ